MKDIAVIRVLGGGVGVAQGARVLFSDFANNGPMWSGDGVREVRHRVDFNGTFREPPMVHVGISLWDTDHATNLRADVWAENVAEGGFDIVFRTWGDTRIARLRADWMAFGPVRDDDLWDVV